MTTYPSPIGRYQTLLVVASMLVGLTLGVWLYYVIAQPSVTITCSVVNHHSQHAPLYIKINGQRLRCQ
jgi:hypothetical protein